MTRYVVDVPLGGAAQDGNGKQQGYHAADGDDLRRARTLAHHITTIRVTRLHVHPAIHVVRRSSG